MILYNQAFDLYHTIYRLSLFIKEFNEEDFIEVDRIRIWDFYLLFPYKVHDIRLKREEKEVRSLRKQYLRKGYNPYNEIMSDRKIFEKLQTYQLSALTCLASYNIIDKESLALNRVKISSKEILAELLSNYEDPSATESNVITIMTSYFYKLSLFGGAGLKNKTNLMESKYDAE